MSPSSRALRLQYEIKNWEVGAIYYGIGGRVTGLALEPHNSVATAPNQTVNINFVNISSKFHNRQNK